MDGLRQIKVQTALEQSSKRALLSEVGFYLTVHPAQAALLDDEVTGRLQEVGAEVTLLDVVVLIAAVSGPGPGPDRRTDFGLNFNFWYIPLKTC